MYALIVIALVVAACKEERPLEAKPAAPAVAATPAPAPVPRPADDMDEKMRHCPLAIEGVTATLSDTTGGVQFEIRGATVDEIRRRAHHVVEFAAGKARAGVHGGGKGGGTMRNCPVVTSGVVIKTDEVDGGARVTITSLAPDGIDELRRETRARADKFPFVGATIVQP